MKKLTKAALIAVVILAAAFFYNKYRIAPKVNFATVQLTDLEGKPVNLQDYKDNIRFINFFATWCGPCMGEMESLDQAAATLQKENFVFICISDEPVELIQFLQKRVPHLVILHSAQKLTSIKIATLPTSYLLNKRSEASFKKIGVMDWGSAKTIEELKKAAE